MKKKDSKNENYETLTPDMFSFDKIKEDNSKSFLYPVFNKVLEKKFNFSISLTSTYYIEDAKRDAIFILRSLMSIYSRGFPSKKCESLFEKNLLRETYLKSGKLEAEILARDALIEKFFS